MEEQLPRLVTQTWVCKSLNHSPQTSRSNFLYITSFKRRNPDNAHIPQSLDSNLRHPLVGYYALPRSPANCTNPSNDVVMHLRKDHFCHLSRAKTERALWGSTPMSLLSLLSHRPSPPVPMDCFHPSSVSYLQSPTLRTPTPDKVQHLILTLQNF